MSAKQRTKKDLVALLEEEAAAAEANPDAPITDATTVSRGHGRSKTLQIRLNPEELEELERVAASRGLPTSTVAREAIMRMIRPAQLRSADARRLVENFARYVDSLDTRPAPSGVGYVANLDAPAGVSIGPGLAIAVPRRLVDVDVAYAGDLVAGDLLMGTGPIRAVRVEATDLYELGVRLLQRAEELSDQAAHQATPESADAPSGHTGIRSSD
jgi:hypothetical protein